MSWICPKCKRAFRSRNQPHSCTITGIDHHFADKPAKIKAIYDEIIESINGCGQYQVSFLKNAIIVAARSTFMAIKPHNDFVDLEFILTEEINEFPIHKTFRISKNKIAHLVKIGSPGEVDESLMNWIKKAYEINAGRKERKNP